MTTAPHISRRWPAAALGDWRDRVKQNTVVEGAAGVRKFERLPLPCAQDVLPKVLRFLLKRRY